MVEPVPRTRHRMASYHPPTKKAAAMMASMVAHTPQINIYDNGLSRGTHDGGYARRCTRATPGHDQNDTTDRFVDQVPRAMQIYTDRRRDDDNKNK